MERQSDSQPMLYYTSWIFMNGSVLAVQMDLGWHGALGASENELHLYEL